MPYHRYKANCKGCMIAKNDKKFAQRVRHAFFDREPGDESVSQIAIEYDISSVGLYNHCKKHLTEVSKDRKAVMTAKKIADVQANAQKKMELAIDSTTIDAAEYRPLEIIGLDEYIAQGVAAIRAGDLKLTATNFLGAVKLKTDWSSKQQTNKLELLRTIAAFRSGANKEIKDVTEGLTTSIEGREDEPNRIYREAFGDAAPSGAEEVSDRDDEAEM